MSQHRRRFLATSISAALAGAAFPSLADDPARTRKSIAAIATSYFPSSHAHHIIGRFLHGYTLRGEHHVPDQQVVSLYVAQVGPDDMSGRLSKKFGFRLCRSIREALVLDGDALAVDGVLLIGEHGKYPVNEIGQRMYPRHEFLTEIVAEFRRGGRSVPVFSDKHLSYSWKKAAEMVVWSRELNFRLQAGSALPVTWRVPDLELPLGTQIEEAVAVGYGPPDSYGFHALETLQCHVERRQGGETGLRRVQTLTGDAVWKELDQRAATRELFDAALGRSYTRAIEPISELNLSPMAFRLEYRDGLRATVFLLDGLVTDFTFAARIRGQAKPVSTLHLLTGPPAFRHFDAVAWNIERLFSTGKAVIPVERTLLTSGALEALHQSLHRKSQWVETPHLNVTYTAPEVSGHFRGPVDPEGQAERMHRGSPHIYPGRGHSH